MLPKGSGSLGEIGGSYMKVHESGTLSDVLIFDEALLASEAISLWRRLHGNPDSQPINAAITGEFW